MAVQHAFDLSFTSPSAAGTQIGTVLPDLTAFDNLFVVAGLQGATGGTLDVYLQVRGYRIDRWVDYAHYAQQAAAAALNWKAFTTARQSGQTTLVNVGVDDKPVLAANTVVGGPFGAEMRTICVAGAGTSAGALITLLVYATGT